MVFVPAPRGAHLVPVYYGIARVGALAELGAKKRHESRRPTTGHDATSLHEPQWTHRSRLFFDHWYRWGSEQVAALMRQRAP
jgi:hypothetical protein